MSEPAKRSASELDAARIAAAALAVADAQGAGGFTMRAVAEALGVTPMALYHHVEDKAALAALLVDAAIRQHPLPPPTGVWRDDLWTIARWTPVGGGRGCWRMAASTSSAASAALSSTWW